MGARVRRQLPLAHTVWGSLGKAGPAARCWPRAQAGVLAPSSFCTTLQGSQWRRLMGVGKREQTIMTGPDASV